VGDDVRKQYNPRWRSRLGPVFDAILKPEKEFANQAALDFSVKVVQSSMIPPIQSVYPSYPSG
jgi:hypothetical protein